VQKACADIAPLFVEQNRELSLQEKTSNTLKQGNFDTLFRAFLNLLENALKYTPEGSDVDVIIEAKKVTIRDYGTPISDDHKAKIFERFEKLPQDANNKGSGLGLSIVKRAAEIHGGAIYIVSRKDGNDFVFDLDSRAA
ncbi:MAG: sensor histidine kinase, partial [Bdellovibrionales bacterium]